jgi:hypothetical protein
VQGSTATATATNRTGGTTRSGAGNPALGGPEARSPEGKPD